MPTGTVTFFDNGIALGNPILLDATGEALLTTSALTLGSHTLSAQYRGDSKFLTTTSPNLTEPISQPGATTTLASSNNPSTFGDAVTLTATVAPPGAVLPVPTGSATFFDNGSMLATVPLDGSGKTAFRT